MKRFRRPRAVAAVLVACGVALAAGCGGDESVNPTETGIVTETGSTVSTATTGAATGTTTVAPGTTTQGTDTEGTTTGSVPVDTATYVRDVQSLAQALTQFGLTLQAASEGPQALRDRSALLRRQLQELDAVAARMSAYTVDAPALEEKRAAIVAATADVTRLGRQVVVAAEAGDHTRVVQLTRQYDAALKALQVPVDEG